MHPRTRTRGLWWCVLLALGAGGLTPGALRAQPPVPTEVVIPVKTSGTVGTPVGPMIKKIEVIPPIAEVRLTPDLKGLEITPADTGFIQVRLLDAANNLLQVINVQAVPPDLEIPFGDTKVFQAAPGATWADVRVTVPDVVKVAVTPDKKQVEVTGINLGATKLTLIDNAGKFQVYSLIVVPSEKYVQFKIRQAVPTATVYPVMVNKGVFVLNGTVDRADDIPAVLETAKLMGVTVINALRVPGVMQVQLDVVIATVARDELRQMDFRWFFNDGNTFLGSVLNAPGAAAVTATNSLLRGSVTGQIASSSNLVFGVADGHFFGFLTALRSEGLAKFLACPKLVTMSGKPATFQAGGRLAVPEPSGLGTTAVRFEDFGTQLSFLPIVMGNGKIFLEVEPRVDNINQAFGTTIQGTTVPGFSTERLHASIELEAGQTFAVGGLIQHEVNATTFKVPVLGDLPFVGAAFRSVSHDQKETELVILVTPYLVDGMACNQLPKQVPSQETRIPDDFELFLEGVIEAPRGPRDVFHDGIHYQAPYLSSPSASVFPCNVGGGNGHGHGWRGGCGNGACGNGGCGNGNGYVNENGNGNGYVNGNGGVVAPAPGPQGPAVVPPTPAKASVLPTSYPRDYQPQGQYQGSPMPGQYQGGMDLTPQSSGGGYNNAYNPANGSVQYVPPDGNN